MPALPDRADLVIIGAGAAGLAAAIFAAKRNPNRVIAVLDGAKKLGAKILVSGGGRCNVTNKVVTPADFCGGSPNVIRRVLQCLSVSQTVEFFREIGVALHEEEHGKLFPDSNSAKTVLGALLSEARRRGVQLLPGHRVETVERRNEEYEVTTALSGIVAKRIVLATGGQSLPKTGSDGHGYAIAQHLGHGLVPTTPALVPLILDGSFHQPLSGISHIVELTVHMQGEKPIRHHGSLLWTHFGVSGPVVLDVSRLWHRARLENRAARISMNMLPGESFESAERLLMDLTSAQPRVHLHNALAKFLAVRLAEALVQQAGIPRETALAHLSRDQRRRIVHALTETDLPILDSRGYGFAEVTAGGIPLDEIDPRTMESRISPGLHLIGEILDVDGRIGGFNFQWAWSGAWVAAAGLD